MKREYRLDWVISTWYRTTRSGGCSHYGQYKSKKDMSFPQSILYPTELKTTRRRDSVPLLAFAAKARDGGRRAVGQSSDMCTFSELIVLLLQIILSEMYAKRAERVGRRGRYASLDAS